MITEDQRMIQENTTKRHHRARRLQNEGEHWLHEYETHKQQIINKNSKYDMQLLMDVAQNRVNRLRNAQNMLSIKKSLQQSHQKK